MHAVTSQKIPFLAPEGRLQAAFSNPDGPGEAEFPL